LLFYTVAFGSIKLFVHLHDNLRPTKVKAAMVIHVCAPAAIGAAGNGGAAALGLGLGKSDLELNRDVFKQQMRQSKRLWTAEWAEASIRHGEQCMQAAQQHVESQAMATSTYFQAEKLASQSIKLARDQDSRSYEMTWRAEVRESLRDELCNQNNRFNIVMLCNTVCLGCVFTLVADGLPPVETPELMLNAYVFCLGVTIMLFSTSLWGSVIVVRRLHDNTAASLERKLFVQSEDLQEVWQHQLLNSLPTGPHEMHQLNQAFGNWVAEYLDPIGRTTIHMLSIGVVMMFITAGLLVHNKYLIEYKTSSSVPIIFWSTVIVTSVTILCMKYNEDRQEKKKEGVYDISWQDDNPDTIGPFAKISKAAEELFSSKAIVLGDTDRMESFGRRERIEREFCAKTQSLHRRVESMRKESDSRTKTRKDVMQLLTTATEELDTLPEELISHLNKMIHSIDEADTRTTKLVAMHSESMRQFEVKRTRRSLNSRSLLSYRSMKPMAPHPIDAQKIPVSLTSLRKKLGEIPITTLLALKNLSDEPLRLKSGVQLKEGKYVKSLKANDPHENLVCYHLYPGTEIPPRTEVLVAARSGGGGWVPTSGIDGEIVYTNRDESWNFKIFFRNSRVRKIRKCRVEAYPTIGYPTETKTKWHIYKDELDRKANNEIVISIDISQGEEATKTLLSPCQSLVDLTTDPSIEGFPMDTPVGCSIECIHNSDKGVEVLPV